MSVLKAPGRPKIRLQAPAVILKVSASLQPSRSSKDHLSEPYLPDGIPFPSNILQPLQKDPTLHGMVPQLSTLRLSRRSAAGGVLHQEILPIEVVSRRPIRAIPALSSRVRFHRFPFRIGQPSLIAALELDIPGFALHPIEILDAKLHLVNGTVSSLDDEELQGFPLFCQPRGSIVRLYSLSPITSSIGTPFPNLSQTLDVTINVRVHVSHACYPRIEIRFKANADFRVSANADNNRTSLSNPSNSKPAPVIPTPALQGAPGLRQEGDMGIIMQFNAPKEVYVGKPFKWDIFVINRSSGQRRLTLTMLSKRKSGGEKRISSRPTSINTTPGNHGASVADPFVDDNRLYTKIKSQAPEGTQLVCLNSDLRVGYV